MPAKHSLVLLAPSGTRIPGQFRKLRQDHGSYKEILEQVQKLRGQIMVEEGAIREELLEPGFRHRSPLDEACWHMVSLNREEEVDACVRFRMHPSDVAFELLGVRQAAHAGDSRWSARVRRALRAELARAQWSRFPLMEVGGWVLKKELRGTTLAVRMAIAIFGFSQLAGGAFGLTTATTKHESSSILRRLGGTSLMCDGDPLPRYFDPEYQCEMELLRFDSRTPNHRYTQLLNEAKKVLAETPVLCPAYAAATKVA